MPIKSLSVVLTANATQLTAGLKTASTQVTAFGRSTTSAATTLTRLSTASTTTATGVTRLGAAARTSATAVARLGTVSAVAYGEVARLGTVSGTSAAGMTRMSTAARAAATSTTRLGTTSTTAAGAVARLDAATAGLARVGAASASMGRLATATTTTSAAVTRMGPATVTAATAMGRLGAAANTAAGSLGRLNGVATASAATMTRLGAAGTAASASTARLGAGAAAGAAATGRLGTGAAGATGAVGRLGASSGSSASTLGRLGQAAGAAGGTTGQLGRGAAQGALAVSTLGASAANAATGGILVLGVALVASVAGAVKFEAAMKNVATIDATVEKNFDAVSQSVLNMSKHLPQSANTLAEGLYNIAGSGFYGADAMNILDVSARAASAGLTQTDVASKAVVATLNAYGMGASQAERVSDTLFSTVNYGVISFEALTSAVAHTVGNAAQAGIQIEEVGAALATMTLSGLSASNAGVSLNNMIAKLIKPSESLSATFQKLGINIEEDLKNPSIGLYGVMQRLREEGDGNLKTWLKWFPEIRAARGAMALASAEGENYARVMAEMGTAQLNAGETARVFAIQSETAQHKLETLKNQIVAAGIELGQGLLPALGDGAAGLSKMGASVKDAARDFADIAAPGARGFADALGNVREAVDESGLNDLAAMLAKLGLGAVAAAFSGLGVAVGGATGLLADHSRIVTAVALAYAAWKIPAIIAALGALRVAVGAVTFTALMNSLGVMNTLLVGAQARLAAFGTSMTAMGAALGVWAGLIYAGVLAIDQIANSSDRAKSKIQGMFAPADANNVDQLRASIQKMDDVLNGLAGETLTLSGKEFEQFEKTLLSGRARLEAYDTGMAKLTSTLGLSETGVKKLAAEAGVNLDKALLNGTTSVSTLEVKLGLMRQAALDAAPATASTAQGLNELSFDAKAAELALNNLTASFKNYTGDAASAEIAMSGVRIQLLQLASGALLAKDANGQVSTSLSTATEAGNENRKTLAGLALAIGDAAQKQFEAKDAIDGTEAATEAYNTTLNTFIEGFRAAGLQAGLTAGQVDAMIQQMNLTPRTLETQVSAPGAAEATGQVQDLNTRISELDFFKAGVNIPVTAPGMKDRAEEAHDLFVKLGILPPSKTIPTSTPGATQATGEVNELGGSLGRLPFNWEVPVATPGATQADGEVDELDASVRRLLPAWNTLINTPGAVQSNLDVVTLDAALGKLPPDVASNITTPGATVSTRDIYALQNAINQVDREVAIRVKVYQDKSALGAALGAAGATSGRSITKKAGGGRIAGPGSGTSDDVPIMASNGEYMIRESAASGYGPDAMAAVNAGRARIIVPQGYAAGGPIRPAPTRAVGTGGGATPASGTTGAIQQIASGATTLADVYQATTRGVIGTARALREVVPRMWRADQQSSSLAASTGSADGQMGRWRDTLINATGRIDENRNGLFALGTEMANMAVKGYPAVTQAVDTQTLARQAETAAQTLHTEGLVLLGTTMDTASGVQLPALTGSTDLQTTATDLLTAAVDLGTQAYGLATEATGLDTDTRDIWTTATDLGTAASDLFTAAVDLATVATGEQTTATTTQTTATNTQTTATGTANTATGTFTGTVNTNSTALNQNAASATAAAAAVREYAAALNAVPKQVTSTVTTNYVTTGTKQAAGFAGGGQIYGPGTGTSDSVPILASRDEWIIRAAAARQYGPAAMSAVNAGTARIVAGSAQGFASGGLVGGYAQGGMVRGAWTPVGGNTTVINNFSSNVTVTGAGSPTETARLVERKVDAKFAQLATRIGARPGRGRG